MQHLTLSVKTRMPGAKRCVGGVIYTNEARTVRVAPGSTAHKALVADERLAVNEEGNSDSAKAIAKPTTPARSSEAKNA